MEEKKKNPKNDGQKKLTYEQLEAYTNQTVAQAKRIVEENKKLVQENNALRNQINFTEISLAFKVLEFKECFEPEFVKKVTKRLQEVLTPMDKEEVEKKEESEKKEEQEQETQEALKEE